MKFPELVAAISLMFAAMACAPLAGAQDDGIEYGFLDQGADGTGVDPAYVSGPIHGVVTYQDISVSRTSLNVGPATGRTYKPVWLYSSVSTDGGVAVIGRYTGHRLPVWYHSYYYPLYLTDVPADWLWYTHDALSMDPWRNTTAAGFLYGNGGFLWSGVWMG